MSLYGIKDASNLTIIDNGTHKPVLYADYCNKTDINFTSDSVYATAKGVKKIGWDSNREGTMSTEMQIFDLKWIALLMGSTLNAGEIDWAVREKLKSKVVSSDSVIDLADVAKTGSVSLFKVGDDGVSIGDEIVAGTSNEQFATVTVDADGTTPKHTKITIKGVATAGEYVCFYTKEGAATNKSFSVKADKFPNAYTVVGDTTIRDTAGQDQIVQFQMNNIKPKSNMELTMSADDVCTLSVEWDIFADDQNDMFTFKAL